MISIISGLSLKQSFNRVKLKPHTTPGLLFKTKIILKMDNLYNLTPICITVRTSHLYHGTKKHLKKEKYRKPYQWFVKWTPFWNASLSVCVKPNTLTHFNVPQPPTRHWFCTRHANTSRYLSLGLNLECVMSRAGNEAPCISVVDPDVYNLIFNAQIFSCSSVFLISSFEKNVSL